MAAGITGYTVLPDALLPFVRTASIRAWRRRGAEANVSFSGIGVSEKYVDIEGELRDQLKMMKNPAAPVVIPEEPADDADDSEGDNEG